MEKLQNILSQAGVLFAKLKQLLLVVGWIRRMPSSKPRRGDLAKQVTEEELTRKRRSAVNPQPTTSQSSSYRIVRNSVLKRREKVYLNVYNLISCNKCLCACGLTINHSSIEVYGVEFAFGGHPGESTGVFETKPFHELIEENLLPPMRACPC